MAAVLAMLPANTIGALFYHLLPHTGGVAWHNSAIGGQDNAGALRMGILSWIILGLLAGSIAKWIMPGRDPGGFIITTILGIIGAIVGGWVGSLVGIGGPVTSFTLGSLVTAIIGALIILAIYRALKK